MPERSTLPLIPMLGIGHGIPLERLNTQPVGGPPGGLPTGDALLLEDFTGYVQLEDNDFILLE